MDLVELIEQRAVDGKITCTESLAIAMALDVRSAEVGAKLDELGIRIVNCQLGCFP